MLCDLARQPNRPTATQAYPLVRSPALGPRPAPGGHPNARTGWLRGARAAVSLGRRRASAHPPRRRNDPIGGAVMPVALGPLTQSSIALATPCAVSAARIGVVDDGAAALSGCSSRHPSCARIETRSSRVTPPRQSWREFCELMRSDIASLSRFSCVGPTETHFEIESQESKIPFPPREPTCRCARLLVAGQAKRTNRCPLQQDSYVAGLGRRSALGRGGGRRPPVG
jgi:hypothetical protein